MGFSELLKQEVNDRKLQEYISGIIVSSKNLLMLINDILDLSKIEANRIEITHEPVSLHLLLNEISQIFTSTLRQKGVGFDMKIEPGVPGRLLLDEVRLRQILFNLIGNAVKFTDSGMVSVNVRSEAKSENSGKVDLYFEVCDTGLGIPEDQFELIFEVFCQREGQSNKKYGGTGLGLTITKRLVEMMNGRISVESKVGSGSTFRFNLPEVEIIPGGESYSAPLTGEEATRTVAEPLKLNGNAGRYLSNELMNRWQSVKDGMMIDEITAFALDVKKLGEENSSDILKSYGDDLFESADTFRVEKINELLEDFPELVEKLV
ncbi:MAG TPA: ATP-binding protein [Ignavibacteriales bacterium]|nr:ATP-binding protein [Ignavibacteriales bacterium]